MPKFEEPPEVQEAPVDRLYCYRNMERVCGADCVAFIPEAAAGVSQCFVLNTQERNAHMVERMYQLNRDANDDFKREFNGPRPGVDARGRPT